MHYKKILYLLTISAHLTAMEPIPDDAKLYQPRSLQTLCLQRISNIIGTHVPTNPFDNQASLYHSQQESASLVEAHLHDDLRFALKSQLVEDYQEYLDGKPWQQIKPPFDTTCFCKKKVSSRLCDFCPAQKLFARLNSEQNTQHLLVYALKQHQPLCIIDMSRYNNVQNISFSPRGSYIVITYETSSKKIEHALIPVTPDVPACMHQLHFQLPSKNTVHAQSVHFSFDDRYLLRKSYHKVDITDLHNLRVLSPLCLPIIGKLQRSLKEIAVSPTTHDFATKNHEGLITIYAIKKGIPHLVASFGPSILLNNFQWMPCGTQLLIQEADTQTYWNPYTGHMQNAIHRLPRIITEQAAHSPCQKYLAYRSLMGLYILNRRTQKLSRMENYYPERIMFDDDSTLITMLEDGTMAAHIPYEYTEIPLTNLLALCWLSKGVLYADKPHSLVQLLSTANNLCRTKGFKTLPANIQAVLIDRIVQKLQSMVREKHLLADIQATCKDDTVSLRVVCPK